MSQSALIAEQTKYRQDVEKFLKPYEPYIGYVEKLSYWESPIHTVGAAVVFTIALNMFVNLVSKTTFFTFAAVILGTVLIGWRISQSFRVNVSGTPSKESLDKIIFSIVTLRSGTQRFIYHTTQRIQGPESAKYLLRLGGFLLVVAFVGSFLNLSTLIWLAVLGLLVVPGAMQKGLHQKVWIIAEPHYRANWPKVAPYVVPAAGFANAELRNVLALDLAAPLPAAPATSTTSTPAPAPTTTPAAPTASASTQTGSEPESSEDEKDWVMPAKNE